MRVSFNDFAAHAFFNKLCFKLHWKRIKTKYLICCGFHAFPDMKQITTSLMQAINFLIEGSNVVFDQRKNAVFC